MIHKHVDWLQSIGMVVNIAKTEAVVFARNPIDPVELDVNGTKFKTSLSMKILGVVFDSRMKWDNHVDKILGQAKKTLNGLRILRRNLSLDGYVHILTSQFYAKLYYSSPVWLPHVSSRDLKRLESIHYKALRIGCNDY